MTTFDTSANILTEVQDISNYTIGTGGTISEATFGRFLIKAEDQVTLDDPGFTLEQCTNAVALHICHQIYMKSGKIGVTSQSLGKLSISNKLTSDLTPWMDAYKALIESVRAPRRSLKTLDPNGITHDDHTMSRLKLDQAFVATNDDSEQPNPPHYNLGDLPSYP